MPITGEVPAPSDPQVSMPLPSVNSTPTTQPSVYGVGVSGLNFPNLSIPTSTSTFAFGGGSATNVNFGGGFLSPFSIPFSGASFPNVGFPYVGFLSL